MNQEEHRLEKKGILRNNPSLAPLKEPEFRTYIVARFFYIMALRMVSTVIAYKLFQLTKSSFSIGLVGLSEFVPVFCLALYAGHIIDQSDKRTLLLKGMLSYSLCVLGLILVTSSFTAQRLSVTGIEMCIYGIIFLTGIIRAFAGPATNAILAQLVPRPVLHYASNISSSTWLGASIAGHATAGFFIAWFGVHGTFYIILVYVLLASLFLSRIGKKPILAAKTNMRVWESMKEGLNYVFTHKVMLGAISLDLFAVLFGGAVALIPEFAERILRVGPIGFGWLNAAVDIGAVLMIITLTLNPLKRKQGTILMYAVGGFGLCIIAFGLSDIYWMSFASLVIAGMLDGISVIVRGNVFQMTTPDTMRGRVSAVNSMFVNSSNELGQFESGFTARLMGTVPAVVFGGSMTLLVVIIAWFKAPGLRKFEY
ncbi:MFS transporter [Paraflavisolibacter sp. H34]|uniref:MFS transporter n=1 Tax=Huijunlia imazamoxiresistens TaxID=3127457 RepID=UPI00301B1CFB